MKTKDISKQSIVRKFILLIFISTSFVTVVVISFDIYLEYKHQLKEMNNRLDDIEKTNFDSLKNSLWISDEDQVNLIIKGIAQLPNIEHIEIMDDDKVTFSSGENNHTSHTSHTSHTYTLEKTYQGKKVKLGTVMIFVSLDDLYANLFSIGVTTLSVAIIQILTTTLIIFFVFNHLIGRHLGMMANYARSLNIEELDTPLKLERNTTNGSRHDELSQLVNAFNIMRRNLKHSIQNKNNLVMSLANSEAKFRGILESAADGVIIANSQGEIELINKAITSMTGYTKDELIGSNVEKIIPTRFSNHIKQRNTYFKNPIIRPMGKDTTLLLKKKNNSEIPVEISLTPVKTDKGTVIAAMIQDITHRKRIEREKEKLVKTLESKNAELERFTYTASHDLKSPLVTISGFIGLLRNDIAAGDSDRIESDLTRISEAAKTMQQLLDDLLALSRIGRATSPRKPVHLNDLINDVISLLSGIISSTEAIINVEDKLPIILVEEQRFKEVFLNLIENAIKYRRNNITPEINIGMRSSKDSDGNYVFYVSDNGIGIKDCYHEKIFGLFDRLDLEIEGNGIGLAIVKRIIEVHDGTIWVESYKQDQGTTFLFSIATPVNLGDHQ